MGAAVRKTTMERIHYHFVDFTWSWFIVPLAALGMSILLAFLPFRFHGLTTIGIIVYLLGVVEFFALVVVITTKFMTRRGSFMHSISQDSEALFLSAALLSFGSILIGAHIYGHPAVGSTLGDCLRVVFWIYACSTYVFGLYIYMLLFTKGSTFLAPDMTACWMLPMFPAILVGPAAGIIGSTLDPAQRMTILICGVTFQGLGTLGSIFRQYHCLILLPLMLIMPTVTAIFVFRLFQSHLPQPAARPSLFFVVGPHAFTGVGLLAMASVIPEHYSYFAQFPEAVQTLQTIALFTAIFFWTLAFWFCSLAIVAIAAALRKTSFSLMWYATIFPNVGLVVSMMVIGKLLNSDAIGWVGTGATIVLAAIWLLVQCFHIGALWKARNPVERTKETNIDSHDETSKSTDTADLC